MTRLALVSSFGTGLVLTLAVAGVAWRDCLLLAGSVVLGQRLFLGYMDRAAPWEAWRAAMRCVAAGVLAILLSCALLLLVVGAREGWWLMSREQPVASWAMLAVAGAACSGLRTAVAGMLAEGAFWLLVLAAAWVVTIAQSHGVPAAPCVFVIAVAVQVARSGWSLARHTASGLLHAVDGR